MKKIISLVLVIATLFALSLPANAAACFGYTDEATNNNMAVPGSWYISYGTNELTKVEFICEDGLALMMTYGSSDLYGNLDAATRRLCSRSDIDNSLFTAVEIAGMLGVNANQIREVTISGRDYFLVNTVTTIDYQGAYYGIDTHYWVHISNGWMYLYQYTGVVDCDTYNSFVGIISSADYGVSNGVTWAPDPSRVIA